MRSILLVTPSVNQKARPRRRLAGAAIALSLASSVISLLAFAPAVKADTPVAAPAAQPALPPIALPVGKQLIALSKNARGEAGPAQVVVKVCHGQLTDEINSLFVKFALVSHPPCDEGFSKDVLNGTLECFLTVIRRRNDLRGCFSGRWRLLSASGSVLAAGDMEGTVGSGTHRNPGTAPCEECKDPRHYEGRMNGQVMQGHFQGAQICATLAGTGPLQPALPQQMSIEGVIIAACIP